MGNRFDYFVIFAEMRTGSNFLESNLKEYTDLQCHGEVFNPNIMGKVKQTQMFGKSMQDREKDPLALITLMQQKSTGLPGFRFFHDHDPRVLTHCLGDQRCAKIVLTRNPLDSYISREIARQTNQWRIGDMKDVKSAMVSFDAKQFEAHLASHQEFQLTIQRALQISGQTAFYIGYDDIPDVQILNGLARFLGVGEQKKRTSRKTKKQNPQSLEEKVTNHAQMLSALASSDHFGLYRTPDFEPRRGPMVPGYVAAAKSPILFMPVMSCPHDEILQWLADLDGVSTSGLSREFNQKTLRQWKRQARDHQSFCVLRHPVARLHRAFVERILMPGPMAYADIRDTLRRVFGLPLPKAEPDASYDIAAHRKAFLAFAGFVKGNLAGQSSVRVDGAWASQSGWVRGMGQFLLPTHIFREADLADDLKHLAQRFGLKSPGLLSTPEPAPYALSDFYDAEVEAAVRSAYQRDYMMFGFGAWRPEG